MASAETVNFYDYYHPSLPDGTYRITVEQAIEGLDTKIAVEQEKKDIDTKIAVGQEKEGLDKNDYFRPITQDFVVAGPRFVLDPGEVHSQFPPADSSGRYGEFLPNVVLNRRALPWERCLEVKDQASVTPRPPWLALLVFQENEVIVPADSTPKGSPLRVCKVGDPLSKVGDPLSKVVDPLSKVVDLLSDDDNVLKPAIKDVTEEEKALSCQTLTIRADAFKAVMPRLRELPYLAHVREVHPNAIASQVLPTHPDHLLDLGWFSVVVANRLAHAKDAGIRYHACLVSLEGFESYLDGELPKKPSKQGEPDEEKDVMMAVLHSWSFVSLPDQKRSFADLVENLVQPSDLLLRVRSDKAGLSTGDANADTEVAQRLGYGYVPLPYETIEGETTFAWYRGPLVPVIPPPLPKPPDAAVPDQPYFPSSAAVTIYDARFGVFDHSYAAAWEIGRAAALADGNFSALLLRLRRTCHQFLNQLLDQRQWLERLGNPGADAQARSAAPADPTAKKTVAINPKLLHSRVHDLLHHKDLPDILAGVVQMSVDPGRLPLPASPSSPGENSDTSSLSRGATGPATPTRVEQLQSSVPTLDLDLDAIPELRPIIADMAKWLAKLNLLYFLPFNHLVPDPRMLPSESIRFFYLDQNWLNVLTDGALSIALHSSLELTMQQLLDKVLIGAMNARIKDLRDHTLGRSTGDVEGDSPLEAQSGFLLRSALVAGWPGLQISASKKDGQPLKLLRMDRLAADVLLCLFLDVPDKVTLSEPYQGLCFGVEDGKSGDVDYDYAIHLRDLKPSNLGTPLHLDPFPKTGGFGPLLRDPTRGVLNLNEGDSSLVKQLTTELRNADALPNADLSPAELAIQLVRAPESIDITVEEPVIQVPSYQ